MGFVNIHLRMRPSAVYFLRFILEGYDNLFILTTLDRDEGLVTVQTGEDQLQDLYIILESVQAEIGLDCMEKVS